MVKHGAIFYAHLVHFMTSSVINVSLKYHLRIENKSVLINQKTLQLFFLILK